MDFALIPPLGDFGFSTRGWGGFKAFGHFCSVILGFYEFLKSALNKVVGDLRGGF